MPRTLTTSQINRLGDRLAKSSVASREDRDELQRLIAEYSAPMAVIQDRIRAELGINSTARPKTEKTTIEKLRRDRTRLSKMQDLAGVRIVSARTLREQDALVEKLTGIFPGAKTVDLRDREGNPYRAVHVIAEVDACPVEIQVRTQLQHAWADLFERLADATDRRIRYGAAPRDPAGRRLYDLLLEIAPVIRHGEHLDNGKAQWLTELDNLRAEIIVKGPPPRGDAAARRARRNIMRRVNYRRRRIEEQLRSSDRLVTQMHDLARDIFEGRRRFERGIVE